MSDITIGSRVVLTAAASYGGQQRRLTGTVEKWGPGYRPQIVSVEWDQLGYSTYELVKDLEPLTGEYTTFTLSYSYDGGEGAETPAFTILRAVWDIHYHVIAAHRRTEICGQGLPVYDSSAALVKALIVEAYGPYIDHDAVYEAMIESGEVLTRDLAVSMFATL